MSQDPTRNDIQVRMRQEWDRRIAHDYRYWMSDGVESDDAMWNTGRRDLALALEGVPLRDNRSLVALEVGCGVGRILRAAGERFSRVIGIDVSERAIAEARNLLRDLQNVELVLGNGTDLNPIADESIDLAYSFAALGSMPVRVLAAYLAELCRVIKPGGRAVLQLYFGRPQPTVEQDTIALRSFNRVAFEAAAQRAGYGVENVRDLVLPFEVSDREAGLNAVLVTLVRNSTCKLSPDDIARILLPEGEATAAPEEWPGSRTEYLMAIARATQHLDAGRLADARVALDFALKYYRAPDEDIAEMLRDLEQRLGAAPQAESATAGYASEYPEVFERNLRVLRDRFPDVASRLEGLYASAPVTTKGASGAPVLVVDDLPLDQVDKPGRAGELWAERCLNDSSLRGATELVVAGFAGAYHLEALLERATCPVHCVELRGQTLADAMRLRDLTGVLARLATLSLGESDLRANIERRAIASEAGFLVHPQSKALHGREIEDLRRIFRQSQGFGELKPSIAVVGPLYGGSLPIAAYTARALAGLNQRVRYFDLSSFFKPYNEFGAFLQDRNRLNSLQGSYVEMLSQLLLEAVSERPIDILICLAQAPISGRVLDELRRRGVITAMWFVEDCRRFTTWRDISRYFDYMFLLQRDEFPDLVQQAGAGRAIYLPVGCDPGVHRPLRRPEELSDEECRRWGSAISFLGAGYNNRQQMFATLAKHDFKIWGTEWPVTPPFDKLVQEQGRRIDPGDYVKIFNSTLINLNLHSSMERDGVEPNGDFVNPRTFELAACGAFQLVDERVMLPELFVPGKEVATFTDRKTLHDSIEYYLARPEERAAIAAAGRERALRDHSYERRMEALLGHIYADRYAQLKERSESGPWPPTMRAAEEYPELKRRLEKLRARGEDPRLEALVADVQSQQGALDETDQRILFLHQLLKQIDYVEQQRQ